MELGYWFVQVQQNSPGPAFLLDRIKFEEEKYVFYRHFSRISNSIGTNSGNLLVIPPQEISGYRRFRPNRRNCSLEMILCWVLVYLVCSVNGVHLESVPFKVWLCIIFEIWGSLQNNHDILINKNCDINQTLGGGRNLDKLQTGCVSSR